MTFKNKKQLEEEIEKNLKKRGWYSKKKPKINVDLFVEGVELEATLIQTNEIIKLIDNIEIDFPDEDGEPWSINGWEFKEELLTKLRGVKK